MDEKYQSSRHFHGSTAYSTKMDRRYVISGDAAAKKFNERTVNMDKRYTPEEDRFILDGYEKTNMKTIANHLCRSESSVRARYRKLINKSAEENNAEPVLCKGKEEEIPAQLFVLVKTSNNNIYATNADELITELRKHKDDKVIKFEHYDSIISMIKDDYMHSDVCMAELIRSTWLDKVDFEDIAILLHWAGEEDCLSSFASKEE